MFQRTFLTSCGRCIFLQAFTTIWCVKIWLSTNFRLWLMQTYIYHYKFKPNLIFRCLQRANASINFSAEGRFSLYVSIIIRASNRSSPIDDLKVVNVLLTFENCLSASALETGRVANICSNLWTLGKEVGQHLFNACKADSGIIRWINPNFTSNFEFRTEMVRSRFF